MIFQHTEDICEAACLALVDGKIFAVGLFWLEKLHQLRYGTWAGGRMICPSTWDNPSDYPETIKSLVAKEKKQPEMIKLEGEEDDDSDMANNYGNRGVPWLIQRHYTPLPLTCNLHLFNTPVYQRMFKMAIRTSIHADLETFNFHVAAKYPKPAEQVLCNISKGQYVCAASLQVGDEPLGCHQSELSPRLYYALLLRICWAPRDHYAIPLKVDGGSDPFCPGKWAGDKFGVTTMERLRTSIVWEDVSEEAAGLLAAIFPRILG